MTTAASNTSMHEAERQLRTILAEMQDVVVGFSGGADSALLAWMANDVLGDQALAVTAVSPSLAEDEYRSCGSLAERWGLRWQAVETSEMENAAYRVNDGDRCAHCKDALMDAIDVLLDDAGDSGDAGSGTSPVRTVVLGVNIDDLGDHRPGQQAAQSRGARFPFVEAGMTKAQVRALSRDLGLETWDKPAAACLASRLPYGTPVTMGRLRSVDRAEAGVKALGFSELRIRDYDDVARIEVPLEALPGVVEQREAIVAAVHEAGYRYVTIDLEGLRSGNLNAALGSDGRLAR